MIISKSAAVWGEGADEATFNLEVVGNTPPEVEHLKSLADEPVDIHAKFEEGALKISLSFERQIPLEVQQARKSAADILVAAKKKEAADKLVAEAKSKADSDQKAFHDQVVERAAQIFADRMAASQPPKPANND